MPLQKKDRALLVKLFYQNGSNSVAALREYRRLKGLRKGPMSKNGLKKMIMKFEATGDFGVQPGRGRKPVANETVADVTTAVVERASTSRYSSASARSVSRELAIPWSTVRKILRSILKWYPYKIHMVQMLQPQDHRTRYDFACRFLARMDVDDEWPWKILWSDEAHFALDGAVNNQNCRIWGASPPNVLHPQPLHSDYVTAWCGFTADFILGPFFFETLTPQGPKRCSVTSARYSELLRQHVIPALQERQCLQTTVFMQDGATPHIGREVKELLRANFGENRVISRAFQDAWPPRSPDLNPCDFWLWGFLKDRVYSGGIRTIPELKASITRHVADIPRELLRATIAHAIMRFQRVIDVDGAHVEHIL